MGNVVSAGMAESVSTSEIVSMKTVMRKAIVVPSTVWMAQSVSVRRSVGVSTAAATPSTWVTYVIAALSRNHTKEERQSC